MKTYNDMITNDRDHDFALFTGALPEGVSIADRDATVDFFVKNFGDSTYDPDNEDEVVEFCQMGPAGNYGQSNTVEEIAMVYPGYTTQVQEAVCQAWMIAYDL